MNFNNLNPNQWAAMLQNQQANMQPQNNNTQGQDWKSLITPHVRSEVTKSLYSLLTQSSSR